ncbi:hypothetical protein GEMRC1_011477 [Eukaryota sp. GEM-RC1]
MRTSCDTTDDSPLEDSKRRICFYESSKFTSTGSYSNSFHSLTKIEVPNATTEYTVVVDVLATSSYSSYSISVSATCPVVFRPLKDLTHAPVVRSFTGNWGEISSGGRRSSEIWHRNPQYSLKVTSECDVEVYLSTEVPRTFVGLVIAKVVDNSTRLERTTKLLNIVETKTYREQHNVLRATLGVGNYMIVPSTYELNQYGSFDIRILGFGHVSITKL